MEYGKGCQRVKVSTLGLFGNNPPKQKLLNERQGHTWSHIHDAQSRPSNAASTLEAKKKLGLSGS